MAALTQAHFIIRIFVVIPMHKAGLLGLKHGVLMVLPLSDATRQTNKANVYAQVIHALMLRDMRTRFGGSHWGYVVTVLWPVAHIFVVVGVMAFRGMQSPMGNNPILFVATGAVPVLMFQYISREFMKAVAVNRPLTYYPQVKVFDLIIARLIVEIIKGFSGLFIVVLILFALGVDPVPADALTAIYGYLAAILFGVGIGAVNIGIVSFFPGWMIGYSLFIIIVYITSGVFFAPSFLPDEIYWYLRWNPVVQIVEWVRLGYDPSFSVQIDYAYVLLWGIVSLMVGLLMERLVVRKMS